MLDETQMRERLRRFLAAEILLGRAAEEIGEDEDLVALGLDSLSVLRLLLFLETEFGVSLDGEDVLGDELATVRAIAARCAAARES